LPAILDHLLDFVPMNMRRHGPIQVKPARDQIVHLQWRQSAGLGIARPLALVRDQHQSQIP
jgi:hypothetical protein